MNCRRDHCERYREDICLLLSGGLSEPKHSGLKRHLAICPDCRNYHEEMRQVSMPLANWENELRHIEPDQAARVRWANAVRAASRARPDDRPDPAGVFLKLWRELIWPVRRIWLGFAFAWLVIIALDLSSVNHQPRVEARNSVPAADLMAAWKQQQKLMVELTEPREAPVADRSKPAGPAPRSERQSAWRLG